MKIVQLIVLTSIALMITLPVMAQGGPPATPIDGGLSLLLAAGGAYALKKLKTNKEVG